MSKTAQYNPTSSHDIAAAASILRDGGCVAFPTETVFGLGVDATSSVAVKRAFEAKGRPSDNPLIVHLHSPDQLPIYCHSIPDVAYQLMERFCPGPLTIVLPRRDSIVKLVTAGLDTVAIRFPKHDTALALLRQVNLPIAAPSANLSGRPSATTWQAVVEDLDGRIDGILCGEPCDIGIESTVVDVTRGVPVVLRCGGVTLEQLQEMAPKTVMLNQQLKSQRGTPMNSPGLRHRHYQPTANVMIVDSSLEIDRRMKMLDSNSRIAYIGMNKLSNALEEKFCRFHYCENESQYAAIIFIFFRECDHLGVDTILCQSVPEVGIGRALMDRIRRASEN